MAAQKLFIDTVEYYVRTVEMFILQRVLYLGFELSTYSDIAQARPKPSYVEVPLPSSSMMIKEFSVADWNGRRAIKLLIHVQMLLDFYSNYYEYKCC